VRLGLWTLAALILGCRGCPPLQKTAPAVGPAPKIVQPAPSAVVLVGAGDIASCALGSDEATAKLLDAVVETIPSATVFTLGDNAYYRGSALEFGNCYVPTWGRHKARTRPAVGNHEYLWGSGALPYYTYFGEQAGPRGKGYYSYNAGTWHVVVLNSNCREVSCEEGSEQERWLRADLAANPSRCTLAYWHHPRFSSGEHGNTVAVTPLWKALQDSGAEVVLTGHEHHYERFAPQDAEGNPDPQTGLRQFIVGTGGISLRTIAQVKANSEVRSAQNHGVLRLDLKEQGYEWKFLPVAGGTFSDSGSGDCH